MFRVGDKVKFKKPRRNPIYGEILHIETIPEKVQWSHGGLVPLNISVQVDKIDSTTGVIYGTELMKVSDKKLLFVRGKT